MKITFVEYDDYYIGFAHTISMCDNLIDYLKEIHIMFLGNKQLYVFLNRFCLVITSENVDNPDIQLNVAGKFSRIDLPEKVNGIHNSFSFDINDESYGIEARLDVKSSEKYINHLNECLEFYSRIHFILEFDVIKSL
jgi:hypothetical protein